MLNGYDQAEQAAMDDEHTETLRLQALNFRHQELARRAEDRRERHELARRDQIPNR
jgi:hypothetical protein